MRFETVKKNLRKIGKIDADDLESEIVEAFDDYRFRGETDVMISEPRRVGYMDDSGIEYEVQAYVNHADAPIAIIGYAKDGDEIIVKSVR